LGLVHFLGFLGAVGVAGMLSRFQMGGERFQKAAVELEPVLNK
jgi:hypothetical protein